MTLITHIVKCSEFGMPLDSFDLRLLTKSYLDNKGKIEKKFKNNMPGKSWVKLFIKRHKKDLSKRKCQNIKRARAKVGKEILEEYFSHLEHSLEDVHSSNILNYDETNCSDDPGVRKMLFKRGCKYPERCMNYTKGCISLMFAGTAAGELLPPYIS